MGTRSDIEGCALSGVTRKMTKAQKVRRKFKPEQRVMGRPGNYGTVVGYEDTRVVVWWDSGEKTTNSLSSLSLVKKDSL